MNNREAGSILLKLVITFNHKDCAETITLSYIETALAEKENGSDLVSSGVPKRQMPVRASAFLIPLVGLERAAAA